MYKSVNTNQNVNNMKNSVQLFLYIALIFLGSIWTISSLVHYEKQIESLEIQTDSLNYKIDSLNFEIDTLKWNQEIWEHTIDIQYDATHLLSALIMVESMGNDSAHARGEDAVGCLQIRKTMVDDVNRILKRKGKIGRFTYHDRWMRYKSIQMFEIYCNHYNLTSNEEIARCWNGGPRGMNKNATTYYWNKVQDYLDS